MRRAVSRRMGHPHKIEMSRDSPEPPWHRRHSGYHGVVAKPQGTPAMEILGIDLGTTSTKSVSTLLDTETGELQRSSFPTSTDAFIKLFNAARPERVVVEPTPATGLIVDLCQAMKIEIIVANTRGAMVHGKIVRAKRTSETQISSHGYRPAVRLRSIHIPDRDVRECRIPDCIPTSPGQSSHLHQESYQGDSTAMNSSRPGTGNWA